jgi:hypothetical protein
MLHMLKHAVTMSVWLGLIVQNLQITFTDDYDNNDDDDFFQFSSIL